MDTSERTVRNVRARRYLIAVCLCVVLAYGGAFFVLRKGMTFTFIVTTSNGDQVFRTTHVFYFFKDRTSNYVAYYLFSPLHSFLSDDERELAKALFEGEEHWLLKSGRKVVYVSDTDVLRRSGGAGFK